MPKTLALPFTDHALLDHQPGVGQSKIEADRDNGDELHQNAEPPNVVIERRAIAIANARQ